MAIEPHSSVGKGVKELFEKINEQSENSNHETLQGLLGGDASGHYHITALQLQQLENNFSGGNNHEALNGLLGGNASGHFHLSQAELNKLASYPLFSSLNHESLQGLLGGDSAGHYHLTVNLLNKLINLPDEQIPISNNSAGKSKLVSKVFKVNGGANTNYSFIVPSGVTTVYFSGCAGGGGTGKNSGILIGGWSGGQCLKFGYSVNSGDLINISVGAGGEIISYSTGEAGNGGDTTISINGSQVIKLNGGYSGSTSGINPAIGINITGYQEKGISLCSIAPYSSAISDIQSSLGINSTWLDSFKKIAYALDTPSTMFGYFGKGGCLKDSDAFGSGYSIQGHDGIVIMDYIENSSF